MTHIKLLMVVAFGGVGKGNGQERMITWDISS